ncbi:tetratricopeptide repeat protein [Spirulina major]|uniref:tetratricopeptide repeat protein n=1 Tax=Spirulina major TaxID=270636 RepID=UPI0009FF483C|nr:tetratricopeptide repeat protein [Spirulina major]
MPKRNWIFSILAITGLCQLSLPAQAQALLPYRLNLNSEDFEEQGLGILQDAVQLTRFEQYDLAFPRAKLAAQLVPQEFRAWFLLGSLQLQNQDYSGAIDSLETAQTLMPSAEELPERSGLLFMLGSAYFQNEQYVEAKQVFKTGLTEDDESIEAWFDLGNTHYKLAEYGDAIAAYRKALALEADFWPAINNIGLVVYEQGDSKAALEAWQEALKIDENAVEPMLAIAVARYAQNPSEEAIRLGQLALSLDPAYGDLDFLILNLWGDRLIADTQQFFALPAIQDQLSQFP